MTTNETAEKVARLFQPLWPQAPNPPLGPERPLLAHYTSIEVLEQIFKNREIWFSNPLFMNDLEEVRFGINTAFSMLMDIGAPERVFGSPARQDVFKQHVNGLYNVFAQEHALNTYVLCFSQHNPKDNDGLLSMWRGYGAQGKGACIVFDTASLRLVPLSPLIIDRVEYGSTDDRISKISQIVSHGANIIAGSGLSEVELFYAAHQIFERLKMNALFSKHIGFEEEDEVRVVYMPDRDKAGHFAKMLHYAVGRQGMEPKLKLKIEPLAPILADDLTLEKITDRIILGPSLGSPLVKLAFERMLEITGHAGLKDKVKASSIPFRAT